MHEVWQPCDNSCNNISQTLGICCNESIVAESCDVRSACLEAGSRLPSIRLVIFGVSFFLECPVQSGALCEAVHGDDSALKRNSLAHTDNLLHPADKHLSSNPSSCSGGNEALNEDCNTFRFFVSCMDCCWMYGCALQGGAGSFACSQGSILRVHSILGCNDGCGRISQSKLLHRRPAQTAWQFAGISRVGK